MLQPRWVGEFVLRPNPWTLSNHAETAGTVERPLPEDRLADLGSDPDPGGPIPVPHVAREYLARRRAHGGTWSNWMTTFTVGGSSSAGSVVPGICRDQHGVAARLTLPQTPGRPSHINPDRRGDQSLYDRATPSLLAA